MSLRKGGLDVACMSNHVQSDSKTIGRRRERESEITNNKNTGSVLTCTPRGQRLHQTVLTSCSAAANEDMMLGNGAVYYCK
jgi:hypothetical protein